MRRGASAINILLCDHMLQTHKSHIKQVHSLFFHFSFYPTKHHFFSTAPFGKDPSLSSSSSSSSSSDQRTKNHEDLSFIDCSGIAQAVILRCPQFFDDRAQSCASASLKDLFLDVSNVIPGITRRFGRISALKPENVLQMLLGFQSECEKIGFEAKKVEALWGIFNWASEQDEGFKHLPRACEVMASMLIRVGMLREVDLLLSTAQGRGVSLDIHEIFSNLIKAYVFVKDLERAVGLFDQMREQSLLPSLSSSCALLDFLVRIRKTQMAYQVCVDVVKMNLNLTGMQMATFENVIRLLCGEGKIQEARSLVKKFKILGFEPSSVVLNEIAYGYTEKKDFDDMLSFLFEMRNVPDVVVGNKIIHTLCKSFGTERAYLFLKELECLGFKPNEITFGILIGWSCRERNLRGSFVFLSEIWSRGLKPDLHSYNALIGGMFMEGLWKHAREVHDEMVDREIAPNLSTFRTLLAGYCKARQFHEVEMLVCEMVNCGFIELSSRENPISKAFMVLGLNSLPVKIQRDNDKAFSKTEFFDTLGNGLYLDTDLDEYEKTTTQMLEDSILPDFNLLIMECDHGNFKTALVLVDEMICWGQELSLSAFSTLLKRLCASRSHIGASLGLLEKMPKLANQLDQQTLNLLVQASCKKGLVYKGLMILDGMLSRDLIIEKETCTALLMGLCKKGCIVDFHDHWDTALCNKWSPKLEDFSAFVECLCRKKMLKEALQLLDIMLASYPWKRLEVCTSFLEKLCVRGFPGIAFVLVEELLRQGCVLKHVAYGEIMRGLCKEKKFLVAFRILVAMLAKNSAPCLDVAVDLISQPYNAYRSEESVELGDIDSRGHALLNGLCTMGNLREATILLRDMSSNGLLPGDDTFNMLVQGHCQFDNPRQVKELFGVVIRKNCVLEISSYRCLVRLMCMQGRVLCALGLKELMIGQGKFPDLIIYNILLFYLLSSGKILVANKVLHELQHKGFVPDEFTYNFLVYGFCRCKDVSSSVQYFSAMISKGLGPRKCFLGTIIATLCGNGELQKALDLSRGMELRGWVHDSVTQNAIVEGLLFHGKVQDAEQFLGRMVEKNLIPSTINYDNLIKLFCAHGRLNKAVDLINIMLKKGSVPNSMSYDCVIGSFCRRDELDQAMEFHRELLDRDLKPSINTWEMLIHKFCQNGQTEEAERLLISIARSGENPTKKMYSSVIDKYHHENNLRKASELMQMMQRSGYEPDFDAHWSLIRNLSSSNEKTDKNVNTGFLSRLLSGNGFSWKQASNHKMSMICRSDRIVMCEQVIFVSCYTQVRQDVKAGMLCLMSAIQMPGKLWMTFTILTNMLRTLNLLSLIKTEKDTLHNRRLHFFFFLVNRKRGISRQRGT